MPKFFFYVRFRGEYGYENKGQHAAYKTAEKRYSAPFEFFARFHAVYKIVQLLEQKGAYKPYGDGYDGVKRIEFIRLVFYLEFVAKFPKEKYCGENSHDNKYRERV